jgi:hypothetical protein
MNWKAYLPDLRKRGIDTMAKAATALATMKNAPGAQGAIVAEQGSCPNVDREINIFNWQWILILVLFALGLGIWIGWKIRSWCNYHGGAQYMETAEPDPDPEPIEEVPDLEPIANPVPTWGPPRVPDLVALHQLGADPDAPPLNPEGPARLVINMGRDGVIHLPPDLAARFAENLAPGTNIRRVARI